MEIQPEKQKDDSFNIPEWVFEVLLKRQVRNVSFYDYRAMEEFSPSLDLSTFPLVMLGKIADGSTSIFVIRLLSYWKKFLHGPHFVQIYDPNTKEPFSPGFWVNSLTCFRKNFFNIVDRLTFERAAFIIFPKSQKVVRLKCIRAFCSLPQQDLVTESLVFLEPDHAYIPLRLLQKRMQLVRGKRKRVQSVEDVTEDDLVNQNNNDDDEEKFRARRRVSGQVTHSVMTLMTSYMREYPADFQASARQFVHDVQKATKDVMEMTSQSHNMTPEELETLRERLSTRIEIPTDISQSRHVVRESAQQPPPPVPTTVEVYTPSTTAFLFGDDSRDIFPRGEDHFASNGFGPDRFAHFFWNNVFSRQPDHREEEQKVSQSFSSGELLF